MSSNTEMSLRPSIIHLPAVFSDTAAPPNGRSLSRARKTPQLRGFLSAKVRKEVGKKNKSLREKGFLPGIVYGPKMKPISLELNLKDFEKDY